MEALNNEFKTKIHELECIVVTFSFREQLLLTEWMAKLEASNTSLEEMRIRNDFLMFLIKASECGTLTTEPFNNIPPSSGLNCLRHLLPPKFRVHSAKVAEDEDKPNILRMFKDSPDRGVFLSQQPVPISGAFCFLVIKKIDN